MAVLFTKTGSMTVEQVWGEGDELNFRTRTKWMCRQVIELANPGEKFKLGMDILKTSVIQKVSIGKTFREVTHFLLENYRDEMF